MVTDRAQIETIAKNLIETGVEDCDSYERLFHEIETDLQTAYYNDDAQNEFLFQMYETGALLPQEL